jgi:diguanylate cyclase (GGDEF)-like protein/PAS domain S-box-containing protein
LRIIYHIGGIRSIDMTPLIDMSDYNRGARAYWWAATLAGAFTLCWAVGRVLHLNGVALLQVVALMGAVVLTGLRPIRVPGTITSITPCDLFVFLTALGYGAPAATLVAVTDAFAVSCRTSRRWTSRLGGPAIMAISVYASASLFRWALGWFAGFQLPPGAALFAGLILFSLGHFALNTLLLATGTALKQRAPLFSLWWTNFAWISLTYTASAAAAGLIYLGIKSYGVVLALAAGPLVAVIFAACYFYFKQADERARADRQRIEAAMAQAAQAERHLRELQESEERFHSAFDYAAIGMALVASSGRWLQVNRALCQLVGYSEAELLATDFQSLTDAEDLDPARRYVAQLLVDQVPSHAMELRYRHKLGHTIWVLLSASVIRDAQNDSRRLIFQIQDITDRKRAEAQLIHDAFHDALTGLPNRALFMDHLKLALARAQRYAGRTFAVLFLDFDRFKIINDSLGHLTGDQLLVAIARRLEHSLRPGDTVARLGGDEFTILLEDVAGQDEAVMIAERIQRELKEPFNLGRHEIFASASIGIAIGDTSYQRPEDILRDADTAMYRAKSGGRARHATFDQSLHARALQLLQLETDLRRAVERQEFFLTYQPIVSLSEARLAGFEALVRWRHPEQGLVSPSTFIPIAEETGLIVQIGQFVLEQACRQMRRWQEQLPQSLPLVMSVNLSGRQFTQSNLIEQILGTLEQTGLDPRHLKLEVTESVVMENIESATGMLDQLRALGMQLSIDDFGTGYSSLSYLHRLPLDTLKIDRSFVSQMMENSENVEIVRTIVMLAKSLGLDVIAEGVETREQLDRLRQLGCEHGQGYLFARPLDAEAAGQLATQSGQWSDFILLTGPAGGPNACHQLAG